MGLGSRKFSEGSRSLFGSLSIPNLKKSEFADAIRNGVGSSLAKWSEKSSEPYTRNGNPGRGDLSAYGFECFQAADDIEVFIRDTPVDEAFRNPEIKLSPVAPEKKAKKKVEPVKQAAAIENFASAAPVKETVKKTPVAENVVKVPVSDNVVQIPVSKPVAKAPEAKPIVKPVARPVVKPVAKVTIEEIVASAPVVEPVKEAPVAEVPAVEAEIVAPVAEPPVEMPVEVAPQMAEPVVEQPKIEEFDQPIIIKPEIIDDEVEVVAEAEAVDMYVGDSLVTEEAFEPESLFGNIKRGMSEEVDTRVGTLQDGLIKELTERITLDDYDFAQVLEESQAEEAAVDEMEMLDKQITGIRAVESTEAPVEERVMLKPYEYYFEPEIEERVMLKPYEYYVEPEAEAEVEAEAVPEVEAETEEKSMLMPCEQNIEAEVEETEVLYVERAVPKLEDFITEEPEPVEAPVIVPEWEVTEASAAMFAAYISSIPEESTWAVAPAWEVSDEAVDAFAAYMTIWPQYPKAAVIVPEWEVTEACAETFTDYISSIPEESTWAVAPVWDVTEEATEAYGAYLTIWPQYPKAAVVIPEWDTTAESYVDYLSFIPEESTWAVAPVWEVTDEAVDAYNAYLTIWPQYPKRIAAVPEWDTTAESYAEYLSFIPAESTWAVAPVWDVTDEAVDAYGAYLTIWPQYPKRIAAVPEWDVNEVCAETFIDYISSIPEESTWAVAPVWEVTEDAVEAYNAYLTIWPQYPKRIAAIPEWDTTADSYADYLSFIPEESTWAVAPVWDVTDEAVEAFDAFQTIRPEYPRRVAAIPEWDTTADSYAEYLSFIPEESTWAVAPAWDVSEEAVEAFDAFQTIRPEYPKAVAVIPEWDATDAAVAGFEGYRTAEEDYFNQSAMVVATTVSVSRIKIDEIERRVTDAVAAVSGITGNVAETSSKSELLIKVKDNADFNQENLQVVPELAPEKKVRSSRFVFKDGRLQKITEEIDIEEITSTVVDASVTVSEEMPVEQIPAAEKTSADMFALPAAQSFAALPAPVAKNNGGVRFSFGQSKSGYGSVRFLF